MGISDTRLIVPMFHPDADFSGFSASDWSRTLTLLGSVHDASLASEPAASAKIAHFEAAASDVAGAGEASTALLEDFLDVVCPNGRAMVIGVFEDGELWTSAALSRKDRQIDRIIGPEPLRRAMGLLSGDFRRDYRHLVEAVESQLGTLSFGCFAERKTLHALLQAPSPGAWARAVTVRDVIVSPFPPGIGLALGFDAARATLGVLQTLGERPAIDGLRRLFQR